MKSKPFHTPTFQLVTSTPHTQRGTRGQEVRHLPLGLFDLIHSHFYAC
nr:MAG TPA: hypothetical protein [Caudoviricetes sp.]